ncbi:MAG: MarR family transcriptional regulator [Bifidobacteriaceae bacterium]|jgi:DNA-binding MarR family transcriptional regulator|nr:MarR family transcriptional regulator [Bifidobacteriaceae bacterium]MCI1914921.1 MarR family transcriptional regulator [Bifidobacteriaceae bacterium]
MNRKVREESRTRSSGSENNDSTQGGDPVDSSEPLDMELFENFFALQLLMRDYKLRAHMRGGPLGDTSRGQGRILALLKLKDGMRARELARLMGIRVSSLNETLGKMERGGYIERKPYEDDRRIMLIHLTEKGRAARQVSDKFPPLFEGFSEGDKEQLADYLDRMVANLENQCGRGVKERFEREWKRREVLFDRMQDETGDRRERIRRALYPAL